MDINLDTIAKKLYGKLQTRFSDVKIGDETGKVLEKKQDVPKARFFEFPYKEQGIVLGTITITLDQEEGVVMQVGGDLVDSDVPGIFQFIRSMGAFANGKTLQFKVVNLEKSNLDKRDYEFQAKRKEETIMPPVSPVMESKFYGTTKISYQDLGEARIVIKHNAPVNLELAAGRTMHIESIYVENADGERFKYPFKHLNGARALAEHLKHGGNPYDPIGKHITSLSEELAQLRKFKGYVGRNEALSEAMGDITGKVMERIEQVKKEVQALQRKSYYETFAESFEVSEAQEIPEATLNNWIDRLTIRTFNEDLKTSFPFIFKLIDESELPVKELSPEDVIAELSTDTMKSYIGKAKKEKDYNQAVYKMRSPSIAADKVHSEYDPARKAKIDKRTTGIGQAHSKIIDQNNKAAMARESIEDQFESFMHSIVENQEDQDGVDTLFSPNPEVRSAAVEKLNQVLANQLIGGPDGINAIESLKGIIDDPEFTHMLKDVDPDLDARALIQQYVMHRSPEVAAMLQFGTGEEIGGEEPVEPPADLAPAPAPEPAQAPEDLSGATGEMPPAPGAEGVPPAAGAVPPVPGEEIPPVTPAVPIAESTAKLKAKFIKAKECGATLDTKMDFGHREMTLHDAIKECGMDPADVGFEEETQESGVDQILKSIVGFWNKEEHNFTIGGTRAKQKVVKAFKDGEYSNATPEDVKMVLAKIEQMDPSSNEQGHITRLAGLDNGADDQSSSMDQVVSGMKQMHHAAPQDAMKAILQKLNFGN